MQYLLQSHFGTIITASESGILYHAYPEEITPTLLINKDGRLIKYPNRLNEALEIQRLPNTDVYSIKSKNGFLCSDIGGKISWSANCQKLEQFKRVPVGEIYQDSCIRKIVIPQQKRSYFINKSIHQTHDEEEIPEIFQKNVDNIRNMNKEWTYIYWNAKDRKDFIYEYYGWDILKYYLKINPRYGAARADLFRYLCIYKMGGVYLDLKSSCRVPFNNIIMPDDQYLLSQWRNGPGESFEGYGVGPEVASVKGGEFQQWHIIAAAGHPFLERVIHSVLSRIHRYTEDFFGVGKLSVLRVTGPYPYTLSISPCLHNYSHRIFDSEQAGLIYSFIHDHGRVFKRHYSQETVPLIL